MKVKTTCPLLNYFLKNQGHYTMHEDTMELLEKLLTMLANEGEESTLRYIKKELLKNRKEYNKYSIENIMLRKYIVELEKNKAHWEDNIVSLQEKLNAGIDNRIKVIKKIKDKKGDK